MSKPDAGAADNGGERKNNKHRRPRVSRDSEPSTATSTRRGVKCDNHRGGEGVNEKTETRRRRSKEDGHSMSKTEKWGKTDPASATAIDAARLDRSTEDASTPPASPSTTSRGGDSDGTRSPLLRQQMLPVVADVEDRREHKEHCKSNQPRDPPCHPPRTSPHAKTSKDKKSSISFDRQHTQSSQGWSTDEGDGLAEPVVSPATPKRRKRSRSSSRMLSVDHCDEIDPLKAQISPARRPTTKSICTNATSSTPRDGVRMGVAVAPSHDSAAAIGTARGSTAADNNHLEYSGKTAAADGTQELSKPTAFDVVSAQEDSWERRTNGVDEEDETCEDRVIQPRGRSSKFGEDATLERAYDDPRKCQAVTHPAESRPRGSSAATTATDVVRNSASEKETGSTGGRGQGGKHPERHKGRRRQERARERTKRSAGTPGVSRKHQSYSDGGASRKQEAEDPSPVLDVKVIDRGATKHLVLTAGDITEEKPGRSERSRGAATSSANGNRPSRTHHWQRREQQQRQLEAEEECGKAFRERLAVQASGDVVEPPPGAQREGETTGKHTNSRRQHNRHTLPTRPLLVAGNQHPESKHHGSRPEAPSKGLPLTETVASLSLREDDALGASSPTSATAAPGVSEGENSWGASPESSGASSFPGEPAPDRTARYVQQQASFHAEVSENFIDQNSPIGKGADGWSQRRNMSNADASRRVAQHVTTLAETRAPGRSVGSNETHQGTNPPSSPSFADRANGGRQDAREGTKTRKQRPVPDGRTSLDSLRAASHELFDAARPRQDLFPAEALAEDGSRGNLGPHLRRGASPVSRERFDSSEAEQSEEHLSADRSSTKSEASRGFGLHRFQTEVSRNLLSGERPALFFLRPNEGLAVRRVEGVGRLLVTLREEAGNAVLVDGAVVHDSAAHFGNTAVQTDHRFPYVAGHRYEFKAVPAQGVELARRGRDQNETAASEGTATATLTGLNVVFSVMSAYTETARLCSADADRFSLPEFEAPGGFPPKVAPPEKVGPPTPTLPAEKGLARQPTSRNPSPGDRPPSVSVAAALIAPCLSPSPGTEYQTTGTEVQMVALKPAGTTSAAASRAQARTPLDNDNGTVGGWGGRVGEGDRGEVLAHAPLDERNGDPCTGAPRLGQGQSGSGVDATVLRDKPRYDAINRERPSRHPSSVPTEAGSNTNGVQDYGEWPQRTDGHCPDVVPMGGDLRAPRSGAEVVGQPSSETFGPPHREKVMRAPIGDHSMGRLGWNTAWERQQPPPAAAKPGVIPLPRIRSLVETSPRSAFGHMDSGENRTSHMAVAAGEIRDSRPLIQRRRSMAGVDNEARNYPHRDPTPEAHHYGYDDRPARMQHHRPQQYGRSLNEVGRTQALDQPGRIERSGRALPHAEGSRRTLGHSAPENVRLGDVRLGPDGARGGPAPGWRYERRASEGEEPRVDRRRWREDKGWTRGIRPEPTRTLAGHDPVAGDDYQWAAEGPNGDPRRHRFHHGRRAASLSDNSRGDAFPPSVESRWEAGAPSDSRRVERGIRGGGGPAAAVSLEDSQVFKRGDYPQALAMNRMKPRGNNRERRGGEGAQYNDEYGTKKTAQRVRHAGYEPAAYRNPRLNIGSSVTQIGVGDDPGRTPPRWNKF